MTTSSTLWLTTKINAGHLEKNWDSLPRKRKSPKLQLRKDHRRPHQQKEVLKERKRARIPGRQIPQIWKVTKMKIFNCLTVVKITPVPISKKKCPRKRPEMEPRLPHHLKRPKMVLVRVLMTLMTSLMPW